MEEIALLVAELGVDVVRMLIERGATHPDTPPSVSHKVRALLAIPLPTDAVEAKAAAQLGAIDFEKRHAGEHTSDVDGGPATIDLVAPDSDLPPEYETKPDGGG